MDGKKYGIINTHGTKKKNWLYKMDKLLSKKKMVKIAETDFPMGDKVQGGNGLQEGWEAKLNEFANKMSSQ